METLAIITAVIFIGFLILTDPKGVFKQWRKLK